MTLTEKVKSVEALFQILDEEISAFQNWSGLRCSSGCGKCCFKPDITATPLEFLPLAFHAFKAGKAEALYDAVTANESGLCSMLAPDRSNGMCGAYHNRGLICRLFGFSARLNKHGKADLITCQIIKTSLATPFQQAVVLVGAGDRTVPIAGRYYTQLRVIDERLADTVYPVNEAIKQALQEVFHYYAYRDGSED